MSLDEAIALAGKVKGWERALDVKYSRGGGMDAFDINHSGDPFVERKYTGTVGDVTVEVSRECEMRNDWNESDRERHDYCFCIGFRDYSIYDDKGYVISEDYSIKASTDDVNLGEFTNPKVRKVFCRIDAPFERRRKRELGRKRDINLDKKRAAEVARREAVKAVRALLK